MDQLRGNRDRTGGPEQEGTKGTGGQELSIGLEAAGEWWGMKRPLVGSQEAAGRVPG